MDDLTFTLTDSGAGRGCQVEAFSTSRLWFVDDDWAVGGIESLGTNSRGLTADSQGGSVCPFDITSTNWDFWNGTKWNSVGGGAGEIAFSCSPVECKNNNHINMYKGLTMIWIVKLCPKNISKLAF